MNRAVACNTQSPRLTNRTRFLMGLAALVGLLALTPPAQAHYGYDPATGTLTITITSGSGPDLTIRGSDCVVINESCAYSDQLGRELRPTDIQKIVINGDDENNKIDCSGVTKDKFINLDDSHGVYVHAGDGNDEVIGSEFNDEIHGGVGNDTVNGGAGVDSISGDAGDDTLDGGKDADVIRGGEGNDTVDGGDGGDHLFGDDGNDQINGGDGEDSIRAGKGNDTVDGGDADDEIEGGDGDDTLKGGKGGDKLVGDGGNDNLDGGEGIDELWGGVGVDTLQGGAGADELHGGADGDSLRGGDGDDFLYGGGGDDYLYGGHGQDNISGDEGNDTILDLSGDDEIEPGEGDDRVVLHLGSTDTVIDTGGNDTLDFTDTESGVTLDMDLTDQNQVADDAGNEVNLQGQFENFVGTAFDDTVTVKAITAPRNLDGAAGTDTLNFDAQGATHTDDGTTIIVPGLEPITYTNFETVNVLNGTGGAPGAAGLPCAAFVAVPFGMIALMWLLRRKP